MGKEIRPWVLGNFTKKSSWKVGKTGLNQALNMHTALSHSHPVFCYLPLFDSVAKRKLFLGIKKYCRDICPLSQATPTTLCNCMEILKAKQVV